MENKIEKFNAAILHSSIVFLYIGNLTDSMRRSNKIDRFWHASSFVIIYVNLTLPDDASSLHHIKLINISMADKRVEP